MNIRFPLFAKILLWFGLNLLFLGLVFYAVFRIQFRVGLDSLLMGRAGDRIQAVSDVIAAELSAEPRNEWDAVLERFSAAYKVQFYLVRRDGGQIAGEPVLLPKEVLGKLMDQPGPPRPQREGGPPPREGPPEFRRDSDFEPRPERGPGGRPRLEGPASGPRRKLMVHSAEPSRYWVMTHLSIPDRDRQRPVPATLLAMSESIRGGGLFFDFVPWAAVGCGVIFVSVLFWIPLVRGITRSISQITHATAEIAEGRFDVRVSARRKDELGHLGQAINRMAARLSGFVSGQKRFLGDIAHELCSPIARIQMALGILEQRADEKQKAYVEDLREEVQHMSSLVNELLSFSKAGLQPREMKLEAVQLSAIARRVVEREALEPSQVEMQIDESFQVMAEPELLARALANLLRNAVRYGGTSGPITLSARSSDGRTTLTVADHGPGVPEETLEQIFDPFFRIESSRNRDTGGIGLGLAIVKTCVEACQGSVTARNRHPSGLQVEITLRSPPA